MKRLIIILVLAYLGVEAQEIAITFDDAPTRNGPLMKGEERTRRIISHLKRHNVDEAAVFVLTGNIDSTNHQRLGSYVAAGHLLANHSHRHLWIHQAGTTNYIRDVEIADSILQQYPGYVKWFRYPYLDEGRTVSARDSIRHALGEFQLNNGYVTVDNYDWYLNHLLLQARENNQKINEDNLRKIYVDHIYSSIQFYDQLARKHLGRSPRHVLLLHENDLAALFLGDLLTHLKKNGWRIISSRRAYQDPIAGRVPDVLFNGQGRVAAIARENGVAPKDLVQESEDEEYLSARVREMKAFE